MFTRLRRHLGTAGLLVAVVALVAALGGGAVAAQGGGDATASAKKKKGASGLNAKQKRQVIAIAKRFQGSGPAGPAGPAGPGGPAGANGNDGAPGSNGTPGTNGSNGKTVLNGSGGPASGLGEIGDFYIDTDFNEIYGPKTGSGWGSPTPLRGDDGADGEPWTDGGTLPPGETETGMWSISGVATHTSGVSAAMSFPIPLAAPIPDTNVHYVDGTPPAACEDPGHAGAAGGDNPEAAPGNLCVYQISAQSMTFDSIGGGLGPETLVAGAVATFLPGDNNDGTAFGSFAVTACGTGFPCP